MTKLYRGDIMPALRRELNQCDDGEIRDYLRRGLAYILHKGPLDATTERVLLTVGDGSVVTLPGRYESILQGWLPILGKWKPVTLRNHWFEGYESGPGLADQFTSCNKREITAQGLGFVTFGTVRRGERIVVKADHQHSTPRFIYLGGTDEGGREVVLFDGPDRIEGGERLELKLDGAVMSATRWDDNGLRKVRKDLTHGGVTLHATDGQYLRPIALYAGPETTPSYRRYHVPRGPCGQVLILAKLALPPLQYDDEEIPCSNEEAVVLAAVRSSKLAHNQYEGLSQLQSTIMELLAGEADTDTGETSAIPINIKGDAWFQGDMPTI